MLQYIINASAIWLLSLLVFDLFLSKETYHTYNRLYLLITFMLGIILPLWQWQDDSNTYTGIANFAAPVMRQATDIKGSIENSSAAATVLSIETILQVIYFTGMPVFVVLFIKEIISLMITYKKGAKFKDGVWTIVTTGKQHSPYSAFRYVFISSKEEYTPDQLRIILTHEEQHGHLLHFFDLVFMQLARVVFWFHPLVYMYAERLSIVHEFQADAAVDEAPKEYGKFLIEQAILKSAPALSHSFSRSPIKKRILMLTHHSSALSKSKTLLIFPLALVCILCFSKNAFSDDKKVTNGNKTTYRGNTIEFKRIEPGSAIDTTIVVDPETGKESIKISSMDEVYLKPIALNGDKIYDENEIELLMAAYTRSYKPHVGINELNVYIIENMKPELKSLKDGDYYLRIEDIVVNTKGKIVYFNCEGVSATYNKPAIPFATQSQIINKMTRVLNNMPAYEGAAANNKHVPYLMGGSMGYIFTVKKGVVTAFK